VISPTLRRLLGLARPYRRLLIVATLGGLGGLACGLALPVVIQREIDTAILGHHHELLWPLAGVALAIAVVRAGMNFLRRYLSGHASVQVEADLRARLFAHLQGLPLAFHDHWQTGQLLARATSDLDTIRMFLGFAVVFLAFVAITAVGVLVAVAVESVPVALLALALTVPFVLLAARFNHRLDGVTVKSRQAVGEVTDVVSESVGGVRILKAFGVEDRAVERLRAATAELRGINLGAVELRARYIPTLQLLPNLILGVVLGMGGWQVLGGRLSIGGLVATTQYLWLLVVPLRYVGWMLSMARQAIAAAARVFEILDTEPTIADSPRAVTMPQPRGTIAFEGVTFTYPTGSRPALVDVSFTIAAGETVALVGATGSGKSTVAGLLPRFYDPDKGRITVDGQPLGSVTLASLRSHIGVVFDEPVLFSASVSENIAFARPDAPEADVIRAALAAGAHDFIVALPDGYQTRVGEQGFSLSGGQRQRLALARALLAEPPVLILDDPLSSVDVRTESEIEANLRGVLAGRTTILIAHRASTVAMADRVLLLDRGRLIADGTHRSLLRTNPVYRQVLAAELEIEELAT
jgi:ATP-binding cassette subfamily B protein